MESHERMSIEIETLRSANKLNEQHLREADKMGSVNRNLANELDSLKKSVPINPQILNVQIRYREEQHAMEKEAYERELQLAQKRANDLQSILESKQNVS